MPSDKDSSIQVESPDVFVSYSHTDAEWVEKLTVRLRNVAYRGRKLRVAIDSLDFTGGRSLLDSIEEGVTTCEKLILVLSPDYLESDWARLEYQMKLLDDPAGRKGLIIPLMYRRCELPYSMRIRLWIDFSDDSRFEGSFSRLLRSIGVQEDNRIDSVNIQNPLEQQIEGQLYVSYIPDAIIEELKSNAFPVTKLPEVIWQATTSLRTPEEVLQRTNREFNCGFVLKSGKLWTFCNLSRVGEKILQAMDAIEVTSTPTAEFLQGNMNDLIIELLNKSLQRHLRQDDIFYDLRRKRFQFRLGMEGGGKRSVAWPGLLKKARRVVVRPFTVDGETKYYTHHAATMHFSFVADQICLIINPELIRTSDGKRPIQKLGGFSETSRVHNSGYWRDVMFWLYQLYSENGFKIGRRDFDLFINPEPISGTSHYGIEGDRTDLFSKEFLNRWQENEIEPETEIDDYREVDLD